MFRRFPNPGGPLRLGFREGFLFGRHFLFQGQRLRRLLPVPPVQAFQDGAPTEFFFRAVIIPQLIVQDTVHGRHRGSDQHADNAEKFPADQQGQQDDDGMQIHLASHDFRLQDVAVDGVIHEIEQRHIPRRLRRYTREGDENRRNGRHHSAHDRDRFRQEGDKAEDQGIRDPEDEQRDSHAKRRQDGQLPHAIHKSADGLADAGQDTADLGPRRRLEQMDNHAAQLMPVFQKIERQERHDNEPHQVGHDVHG